MMRDTAKLRRALWAGALVGGCSALTDPDANLSAPDVSAPDPSAPELTDSGVTCDPAHPRAPRAGLGACAEGQRCQPAAAEGVAAQCEPGGTGDLFSVCETSDDCQPGLFCGRDGLNGLCGQYCLDDGDCPPGGACRPLAEAVYAGTRSVGFCAQRCDPVRSDAEVAAASDCPSGLRCGAQSDGLTFCSRAGGGRHWATCAASEQCAPGFFCEIETGQCLQYCRRDEDCESGACDTRIDPPVLDFAQRELWACRVPLLGRPCACGPFDALEACPGDLQCRNGACRTALDDGGGATAAAGSLPIDAGLGSPPAACDTSGSSCECPEPEARCISSDTLRPCQAGQVEVVCEGGCVESVSGDRCASCGVVDVSATTAPCALFGTGEVYCFPAYDSGGELVLPPISGAVPLAGFAVAVSVGALHACAVLASGEVRCWGSDAYGQLGRGLGAAEAPAAVAPVPVDVGGTAIDVQVSLLYSCALRQDGSVVCWGLNPFGQLGYGHTEVVGDDETPSSAGAIDLGGRAVQIAVGFTHSCALMEDGSVRCWGDNELGQLGYDHGENIGDDEPPVDAGAVDLGRTALQVVAGASHTCALLAGGDVSCWGSNASGQLGYGDTWTCNGAPADAGAPGGLVALRASAVQLIASNLYSCALLRDGSVTCWGVEPEGGSEVFGCEELVPARTDTTLGAEQLMVGVYGPCVRLRNGEVQCWGLGTSPRSSEGNNPSVRVVGRFQGPGPLPLGSAPRCQVCE